MQRREFLRQLASGLFVATAGPVVAPTRKVFRMGASLAVVPERFVYWSPGGVMWTASFRIRVPIGDTCGGIFPLPKWLDVSECARY